MQDPKKYFRELFNEFGPEDPRSLSWSSRETQEIRFKTFLDAVDISNASLLDIGCGMGDFLGYIKTHHPQWNGTFTGYDMMEEFIKIASKDYPEATWKIHDSTMGLAGQWDHVFCSGALSITIPNALVVYHTLISSMFSVASKTLCFNVLDIEHHQNDDTFFAYNIKNLTEFCKNHTSDVQVIQGYLPYDATFVLKK